MRKSSIRLRNSVYTIMLALLVGGFGFGSVAWAQGGGNLHGPQGDRGERPDRNAARVVADDTMPADDVERPNHRPDRADRGAREDAADRPDRGAREDAADRPDRRDGADDMKTPGDGDHAARPTRPERGRDARASRPGRELRTGRPERSRPARARGDRD